MWIFGLTTPMICSCVETGASCAAGWIGASANRVGPDLTESVEGSASTHNRLATTMLRKRVTQKEQPLPAADIDQSSPRRSPRCKRLVHNEAEPFATGVAAGNLRRES